MNKQELQKKYQEIVLKTNGGNDDYVVALCQIGSLIGQLDEPKQDIKWQKLKEWLNRVFQIYLNESNHKMMSIFGSILDKMQELEGEDDL